MFGFDGYSRTKKMLEKLEIDFSSSDYREYQKFLIYRRKEPISLKQKAINLNIARPLQHRPVEIYGHGYVRPPLTLEDILFEDSAFNKKLTEMKESFITNNLARPNEVILEQLDPCMRAISFVTNKDFLLTFETKVQEIPAKKSPEGQFYYFDPKQKLYIHYGDKNCLVL